MQRPQLLEEFCTDPQSTSGVRYHINKTTLTAESLETTGLLQSQNDIEAYLGLFGPMTDVIDIGAPIALQNEVAAKNARKLQNRIILNTIKYPTKAIMASEITL